MSALHQRSRTPFPETEAPTERAPRNSDGTFAQVTHRLVALPTERPGRPLSGLMNKVTPPGRTRKTVPPKPPQTPGSGVRAKVNADGTPPKKKSVPAMDRMAAFAQLYSSVHEQLEDVIDLDQVPSARPNVLELGGFDLPSRRLLSFVDGKATVRDIIARAGIDRTAAIATLCKLATRRAVTFT